MSECTDLERLVELEREIARLKAEAKDAARREREMTENWAAATNRAIAAEVVVKEVASICEEEFEGGMCPLCSVERYNKQPHEEDCAWVFARKLSAK
jgi:hypothetical protein